MRDDLTALVGTTVRGTNEASDSDDVQIDYGLTGELQIEGDRWGVFGRGEIDQHGTGWISFKDEHVVGVGLTASFKAHTRKKHEVTSIEVTA